INVEGKALGFIFGAPPKMEDDLTTFMHGIGEKVDKGQTVSAVDGAVAKIVLHLTRYAYLGYGFARSSDYIADILENKAKLKPLTQDNAA
ncbi:MAG: hypothetical protein V1895_01510, partial [Parcubacteria group bacterium]